MIRLENVFLRYRFAREASWSLKAHIIRSLKGLMSYEELEALHDVSLEIPSGARVGIIGQNGAGKSTLLKLIARVHRPSEGRVYVEGRVSPLLELGLGFNGELTGRENVFLQGALLGFSRAEMKRRFAGIVDFAEIEEFIDTPIRNYSTGMVARLGFAVATDVDPDVLIVDEALSVGDERFRAKCEARMAGFRNAGKTVVIVSHALAQIRESCERAIWIDRGRFVADGAPKVITEAYRAWSDAPPSDAREYCESRGLGPNSS
jgi:ABC-2 type transport system ATP-binding protein/lipopolysaccharide transport system ATP-binding protein